MDRVIDLNFDMPFEIEKCFLKICSNIRSKGIVEISNILSTQNKIELAIIVRYFISINQNIYKMIDLVRYLRYQRNRLFQNNSKRSNQKFVQLPGITRGSSILLFIVKYNLMLQKEI